MKDTLSLRIRLLGAMTAVFALGLAVALICSRYGVGNSIPLTILALSLIWLISGWSLRPVNGALNRLSCAYSTERRLTANAAHELRTPLAVLTLRLQRARLTGTLDWLAIERELAQMTRLTDQLLNLARKESDAHENDLDQAPVVNLSRAIREAAALVVPLMEDQGRTLTVDAPDVTPIRGNAEDLRDMIRNLLDNALIHGRGTVTVRLDSIAALAQSRIEVADEGPGVPPGQEERVFERFRRLNTESPGSGLGLAIVRHVARTHGGDARFAPGRGLIILTLPAAPHAATLFDVTRYTNQSPHAPLSAQRLPSQRTQNLTHESH